MAINHLGANSRGSDMTESQDDKYLKHNDHIDLLADKTQRKSFIDIGFSSGNVYTLSAEDYTENAVLHLRSDASPSVDAGFRLVVPATQARFAVFNDTGFTCTVEAAGSPTGNTVEIVTGGRADLHNDGESIEEIKRDAYDLSFFADTWTFSAIFGAHVAVRAFSLPKDLASSQAYAFTPSAGGESDRVISIQKNESEIGTITFSAFISAGTFSFAADVDFASGDRLRLVNAAEPSPSESNTLANVVVSLRGTF